MKKGKYIIILLIFLKSNLIDAQKDCANKTEIKQLGIEFCLPDTNWKIEPEDKLKFISISSSTFYTGTKTYTLRIEKLTEDLAVEEYFNKQQVLNIEDYIEKIVLKGIKEIDGKKFYFSKTQTTYKSNNKWKNSYAITYYYFENRIGYALSLVVSDENLSSWTEEEALKIWGTFKIKSLPDNSIFE